MAAAIRRLHPDDVTALAYHYARAATADTAQDAIGYALRAADLLGWLLRAQVRAGWIAAARETRCRPRSAAMSASCAVA